MTIEQARDFIKLYEKYSKWEKAISQRNVETLEKTLYDSFENVYALCETNVEVVTKRRELYEAYRKGLLDLCIEQRDICKQAIDNLKISS